MGGARRPSFLVPAGLALAIVGLTGTLVVAAVAPGPGHGFMHMMGGMGSGMGSMMMSGDAVVECQADGRVAMRPGSVCSRALLWVFVLSVVVPFGVAHAHVGLLLIILSPQPSEHVSGSVELTILAQPGLGTATPSTEFTASLDGRPLDFPSGTPSLEHKPATIQVGETKRTSLRGLEPGRHRLSLEYRPDVDVPARVTSVTFFVDGRGSRVMSILVAFAVAALVALAVGVLWGRRHGRILSRGGS